MALDDIDMADFLLATRNSFNLFYATQFGLGQAVWPHMIYARLTNDYAVSRGRMFSARDRRRWANKIMYTIRVPVYNENEYREAFGFLEFMAEKMERNIHHAHATHQFRMLIFKYNNGTGRIEGRAEFYVPTLQQLRERYIRFIDPQYQQDTLFNYWGQYVNAYLGSDTYNTYNLNDLILDFRRQQYGFIVELKHSMTIHGARTRVQPLRGFFTPNDRNRLLGVMYRFNRDLLV